MSVEAIGAISALPGIETVAPDAVAQVPAQGFGDWFTREVGSVDAQLRSAEAGLRSLAVGNTSNLHEVMIHMEEARLSFQLLAQVRNRLLEAYQEVMRTQV